MKNFRFNKQVDIRFNMKKVPGYDQHYLKQMVYNTINARIRGLQFQDRYPGADNFSLLVNDQQLNEFRNKHKSESKVGTESSHLLSNRKKYYFAWTYSN